jgi:NAD-dependent SIR2 family protein deacetylase
MLGRRPDATETRAAIDTVRVNVRRSPAEKYRLCCNCDDLGLLIEIERPYNQNATVMNVRNASSEDRVISLGPELIPIPERLLLAHARGEVLLICGAGVSQPANLPDFRQLVLDIYGAVDSGAHTVLSTVPNGSCNQWETDCRTLTDSQTAEIKRFIGRDYDVVLGMLERRLDDRTRGDSRVRSEVAKHLTLNRKPAAIHRALVRLADRGGTTTIVTTNFDLLLEAAAKSIGVRAQTYSLGAIPRPTHRNDFSGILHIHGALEMHKGRHSELVLSDRDFGEYYLRRRVVPDFIYDAARLFHLVLIGYSANDPPMRYLLNAVAADGSRFSDLKERFTFFGTSSPDSVALEDWRARGITPIHYNANGNHAVLLATLERWATFSAINGNPKRIDSEIRRIVKTKRAAASEADRDLFDHLIRRSNASERTRLSRLASNFRADLDWLNAIVRIGAEREHTRTH